jgi:hypothetical protein
MMGKRLKSEIAQQELSDRYASHAQRRGWVPTPRWVNSTQSVEAKENSVCKTYDLIREATGRASNFPGCFSITQDWVNTFPLN